MRTTHGVPSVVSPQQDWVVKHIMDIAGVYTSGDQRAVGLWNIFYIRNIFYRRGRN